MSDTPRTDMVRDATVQDTVEEMILIYEHARELERENNLLRADALNLQQTVGNHECALKAMDNVNAQLRAQLAEARKDTERLDWLERNGNRVRFSKGYILSKDSWGYEDRSYTCHDAESLRQAIDAARSATP